MDTAKKRRIRLAIALTVALLLATALIYTSFNASSEARQPSELVDVSAGKYYDLTGEVVKGSIRRNESGATFKVVDRKGENPDKAVSVSYTGVVPDTFQDGREIIVKVKQDGDRFTAQEDSLITKCPSKFESDKQVSNS